MHAISLLQIAPTLAAYFNVPLNSPARPVASILNFMRARKPNVVVLVVIDSLDLSIYSEFAAELEVLHRLAERDRRLFSFEPISNHTTPAFASLLTGLEPESHGIVVSADVATSKIKSILEILDDEGTPTAAVLDTNGAEPLLGRMSYVFGVENREDIVEYDEEIKTHTLFVLQKQDLRFVLAHLRSIDRFAHRGWDLRVAAHVTNENMRTIADAVSERNGMLFICGDHAAHRKNRKAAHAKIPVPLIVAAP
ncbi:MAG TPA: alkaline phosphatase family protein [Desulfobacteria bacterium]|nr:alkaline phosphatase family protein [Desulfobacteria bacterium]